MNSNPMEAKDTTQPAQFLDQLVTQMAAPAKPLDERVVEVIYIDEKDRDDVAAALLLFKNAGPRWPRTSAAAEPLPQHGLTDCERRRGVYAYGRTSNAGTNEGGSKTRQTNSQQGIASKYNLGEIIGYYHDDGVSGATTERPDWSALEIELAANPESALVVEEVDRLFRTPKSATYIMQFLISNKVALYDSKGFVTEQRMMEEAAKATGAYFLLSQRSLDARRRAMRAGKFMTVAPWGYIKKARGVIVPDRDLVPTVIHTFEMRAGGAQINTICTWLDERGIPTPSGKVGWDWSTVRNLLSNYIYIGLTVYDAKPEEGEEFASICVPTPRTKIVDVELFSAAQAVTTKPVRVRKGNGGGSFRSILTFKLKCSACGKTLGSRMQVGGQKTNDSILWCNPKKGGCNGSPSVSKHFSETVVYRAIAAKIESEGARAEYRQHLDEAEVARDLENNAARDRLDRVIAEKQDHLYRQSEKAFKLELLDELGPALKEAKLELDQLKAQRRAIMPVTYVPSVSKELRDLSGALQVLADNVPFRCMDAKSEELIRVVGKVLSTVLFENTEDGRIRQHTILDFNGLLGAGKQSDLRLMAHVIDEYDPPILTSPLRRVAAAKRHIVEAMPGLTDEEMALVKQRPWFGKYYGGLTDDVLINGFDALAALVTSDVGLSDCLRAVGLDGRKGFAKRLCKHRNDIGGSDLVDLFRTLRPDAGHVDRLLMETKSTTYERDKFVASRHPMLDHPLLCPEGGRDNMTDEEWRLVLERMKGHKRFSAELEQATRYLLNAYFRGIREGRSLRTAGDFPDLRLAYHQIAQMHRRGQFNAVSVVLLVHAGLRNPKSRKALPEIPRRLVSRPHLSDAE
jgi:DNA invertase Pin-like site-specific DNA recombinase